MIDVVTELTAVHRETGRGQTPAGEGRTVVLRRRYHAPVDDVWDAITHAERINRWFLPISGDLRVGGHYQLEGNAGGEILSCEPPNSLAVTWVFGDGPGAASIVDVRLTAVGDVTDFVLTHTAVVEPELWDRFGPGAVGVGWDLTLLGLSLHLQGGSVGAATEWMETDEGRSFMRAASDSWGVAYETGGASADEAAAAAANTSEFYVPSG